jgi:hypothetical protein
MTWKPSPRPGADHLALPLDPEQGYLLSRLDGTLDVPTLALFMNLPEDTLRGMLATLVRLGAVAPEPSAPVAAPALDPDDLLELDEPSHTEATNHGAAHETDDKAVDAAEDEEDSAQVAARTTTHRQLFEQRLHAQTVDARVALARAAVEPELSALCFDPTTEVIRSILENPHTGNLHARLIATHHRTVAGLEALCARVAFTHDNGVRRALLQNPLLPASLYRRLWSTKRLLEQFLIVSSREATEQTRSAARDLLRTSFNQRTGEERAELILTTEGRCLASLVGITIDGHTTAILCRRTYVSTLLIQNIARWSAAPPQLIAHLRRQDVVKRNATLRQLLERHPNAS